MPMIRTAVSRSDITFFHNISSSVDLNKVKNAPKRFVIGRFGAVTHRFAIFAMGGYMPITLYSV